MKDVASRNGGNLWDVMCIALREISLNDQDISRETKPFLQEISRKTDSIDGENSHLTNSQECSEDENELFTIEYTENNRGVGTSPSVLKCTHDVRSIRGKILCINDVRISDAKELICKLYKIGTISFPWFKRYEISDMKNRTHGRIRFQAHPTICQADIDAIQILISRFGYKLSNHCEPQCENSTSQDVESDAGQICPNCAHCGGNISCIRCLETLDT